MAQVWSGAILCLFVALVVSQGVEKEEVIEGCVWDIGSDLEQGLEPISYDHGARNLAHLPEITDREGCQEACCNEKDCQIAMIGTPADGRAECFLVSCVKDGQDVCTLGPSTQFQIYRKTTERQHTPKIEVVAQKDSESRATNATDQCLQPVVVGMCRAALPRFYYQASSSSCQPFIYGGCNANSNNFMSLEECEKTCSGVKGPLAGTPEPAAGSEAGPRAQAAPRGRMSGPLNPEDRVTVSSLRKGPAEINQQYIDDCVVPYETGPCKASFPMYYFDSVTQTCRFFTYGGCQGNGNRYGSEDECLVRCTGDQGRVDPFIAGTRGWWVPALFVVGILVAFTLLALTGLMVVTALRARCQRHSSHSDKEELLTRQTSLEALAQDESPKAGST